LFYPRMQEEHENTMRASAMTTKITVNPNGSLRVEGDIEIVDASGAKYELAGRTIVSLCRCGLSQKKPFCDSSHKAAGFQAESRAFALGPPKQKT
jgi:CDGSH-type Zn-finger protein